MLCYVYAMHAGDNSMLILSRCVHVYLYALLLPAGLAGCCCCWFVGKRRGAYIKRKGTSNAHAQMWPWASNGEIADCIWKMCEPASSGHTGNHILSN